MKILITGTAGFIGFHLANRLLKDEHEVVGIDSINDYYDVKLKYARLAEAGILNDKNTVFADIDFHQAIQSKKYTNYRFIRMQLEEKEQLETLFKTEQFDVVINLAAQAGVRYSIENPDAYIQSNIIGFINLLEACRHYPVKHLIYASSSSVYGSNSKIPFSVDDKADAPVSLYAATKKSNELMAHSYSHLYHIPTTGLRFFTVYGPWGRPDMAYYLFADAIEKNNPIKVFNNGKMERDFTFIDDIVESIVRLIPSAPSPTSYAVHNIGNGSPVNLMHFIETIEKEMAKPAVKTMMPMQPGDVPKTWADTTSLEQITGYKPETKVEDGVKQFIDWFKHY